MTPERIRELLALEFEPLRHADVSDAECKHLLRSALALAELEEWLRGKPGHRAELNPYSMGGSIACRLIAMEGYAFVGPDLATAILAAAEKAKGAT